MSIELILIPNGSIKTCALSDTQQKAKVDLEGLFPKFPALDGTFAIFWLDQLEDRHIVGFTTEGSNILNQYQPLASEALQFLRELAQAK